MYCYLFEAKSIQDYLFHSGKLKDVIAASERLDRIIDDDPEKLSLLAEVLRSAGLESDLLRTSDTPSPNCIHFLRCKGGAFYAFCANEKPLLALRSLWTLTIEQLFPSLEFTDALTGGAHVSLQMALNAGHERLAADRNTPKVKFPLATAVVKRTARSAGVSVKINSVARKVTDKDEELDPDTHLHRQAYQCLNMRSKAALQDRFTPKNLRESVCYPIDLENDFQFSVGKVHSHNKEAVKDIALIHIDGNGLGILLRGLQQQLEGVGDLEFCQAFRDFSSALAKATQMAAQDATSWLHENAVYIHKAEGDDQPRAYLPMRPLVLGGDDLTLLCRADLAIEYSKRFCRAFKHNSQLCMAALYQKYLKNSGVKPYLTASGGILFHKAGHPFTHSHHLVAGLCDQAKDLTKSIDKKAGPAALSVFRLSNAVAADIGDLRERAQVFEVTDRAGKQVVDLGMGAYLVDKYNESTPSFACLDELIQTNGNSVVSISRWRQMATHLTQGDKTEADRIYQRALELASDKQSVIKHQSLLRAVTGQELEENAWYWKKPNGELQTLIADLLIVDHFQPVSATVEGGQQ